MDFLSGRDIAWEDIYMAYLLLLYFQFFVRCFAKYFGKKGAGKTNFITFF